MLNIGKCIEWQLEFSPLAHKWYTQAILLFGWMKRKDLFCLRPKIMNFFSPVWCDNTASGRIKGVTGL